MTDEQILNALKSCGDSIAICDDCPYEGRNHCSLLAKQDIIERFNALKAENVALRERLEKAVELPYERKRLLWGDKDEETLLCPDCLTDLMGGIGDETFVVQCPNCGCFVNCEIEPIPFTAVEARLAELKGGDHE